MDYLEHTMPTHANQTLSSGTSRSSSARNLDRCSRATPLETESSALMQQIIHDVEARLMGRFHATTKHDPYQWLFEQTQWVPNLDLFTRGDSIVVRTQLQGLSTEEVNVELEDGVLCISGRSSNSNTEMPHAHSDPFSDGFIRRLTLPDGVTRDDLEVSFENGVLEIAFLLNDTQAPDCPSRMDGNVQPHA